MYSIARQTSSCNCLLIIITKHNLSPIDAIAKAMVRVRGSYALEFMFKDYPNEIWLHVGQSYDYRLADGETTLLQMYPQSLNTQETSNTSVT